MKRLLVVIVTSASLFSLPAAAVPRARQSHRSYRRTRRRIPRRSRRHRRHHRGQWAPTRHRYEQIQAALAAHGYDPGPVDGRWGSRSAAALKQFEQDHQLPADGKLDSLVLITLGLGPGHPHRVVSARERKK